MKPFIAFVAVSLVFFFIAGCGGGNGGSGGGGMTKGSGVVSIGVNNSNGAFPFAFQSPVTVKSGATVQWKNNTAVLHGITWETVVPNKSPSPSAPTVPNFTAGTTSAVFTMPTVTTQTTYNYQCTIHGANMPGMVIVTP